jgi:hypothetical protein
MVFVNYQKRKNTELFKSLEEPKSLFLSKAQNYVPIYTRFFNLNDTNYNSINLNHRWHISYVGEENEEIFNLYDCKIINSTNQKVKDKNVFFKIAPLLDPYKYLIGKYNANDVKLYTLPKLNSTVEECHPKILDKNNSAYVDGLFVYFTSSLLNTHKFIHGVDYYGSFLGVKNDFMVNVFDDIDHLKNSDFFNQNKNKLFQIEEYDHLLENDNYNNEKLLKHINIQHNTTANSQLSIKSVDEELFEGLFADNVHIINDLTDLTDLTDLNDLTEINEEFLDLSKTNVLDSEKNQQVTLKTNSSCSSRSSHTEDGEDETKCLECDNSDDEDNDNSRYENSDTFLNEDDEEVYDSSDEDSYEEEKLYATIPKFPVQVIGMEYCENTFDDLIITEDLTNDEWFSAFMQIIMILITYQKAFNFTHNDLHTNNVMYNQTDKKYIYYCYQKKYYKVPTFGRIFKIIDFGRSIYKFDGKLFCSDSFQIGGDAATQYNTEPYLNEKKPRLEPNYSFDLCRLACSIFDYIIEDNEEIKDMNKCKDPVKRLIVEWCLDDKGVNMLYKNNGADRYPDFKLYKMIARCVHNHTPQAQLERPEFNVYSKFKGEIPDEIINIDIIPSYV